MGTAQTLVSLGNQENVTSNNARSVDDCSSRGLSLQRKSITTRNNSNVMQRMAWVAIKDLDALYSSSASSASAPEGERKPYEPLVEDRNSIAQGNDPTFKGERLDYNKHDLQLHHRHIIFSPKDETEYKHKKDTDTFTAAEKYVQKEICRLRDRTDNKGVDNNIGYGNAWEFYEGPGILFSEDVFNRGYTIKEQISYSFDDDLKLLQAIENYRPWRPWRIGQGASLWYANYDLLKSNCQDWVEDVKKDAGVKK